MITIEFFVQKMKSFCPSPKLLIEQGFKGIHLTVIEKNYLLENKDVKWGGVGANLIESLIKQYRTEYLRFNDYSFSTEIEIFDYLKIFCSSSYSFIAYEFGDGEIIEYDKDDMTIISYVAKNADFFLGAILYVFELKSLRLQGLADRSDLDVNGKYLAHCIDNAGGEKYRNFFKKILMH